MEFALTVQSVFGLRTGNSIISQTFTFNLNVYLGKRSYMIHMLYPYIFIESMKCTTSALSKVNESPVKSVNEAVSVRRSSANSVANRRNILHLCHSINTVLICILYRIDFDSIFDIAYQYWACPFLYYFVFLIIIDLSRLRVNPKSPEVRHLL